jgi:hypothetical protein
VASLLGGNSIQTTNKRCIGLSVRQPVSSFNTRSVDLIKSPTLADTLVAQKVFLYRLKSSYILAKGIALGLDKEKVFSPSI